MSFLTSAIQEAVFGPPSSISGRSAFVKGCQMPAPGHRCVSLQTHSTGRASDKPQRTKPREAATWSGKSVVLWGFELWFSGSGQRSLSSPRCSCRCSVQLPPTGAAFAGHVECKSRHIHARQYGAVTGSDRSGQGELLVSTNLMMCRFARAGRWYQMNSLKLSIRSIASATALQVMRPAWVFTPRANAGSARRASRPLSASRRA